MATTTSTKRAKKAKKEKQQSTPATAGPGGMWSTKAPGRVQKAYETVDSPDGWAAWRKHLSKRKLPSVAKVLEEPGAALRWSVPSGCDVQQAERISRLLVQASSADRQSIGLESAVHAWLNQAEVAAADIPFALECLAWAEALPALAEQLSQRTWWQLLNRLISVATSEMLTHDPLAALLLFGELPTSLAYSFPELAAGAQLAEIAARTLDEFANEPLEATGALHGARLEAVRPTVACLARIRQLGKKRGAKLWTAPTQQQFELLVEYALRLSRTTGEQVFSKEPNDTASWKLLRAAARLCERDRPRTIGKLTEKGLKAGSEPRGLVSSSFQFEDAGLAVLRSDWRRRSPRLAINYSEVECASELALGKTVYWSGAHELEIHLDGNLLTPVKPWEQVCWESDRDIDYIELELKLPEGVVVQRHLALAREDRILLFADAILGSRSAKYEYRASFPLRSDVTFVPESETREGQLLPASGPAIRVAPLALNEWRTGAGLPGSLETQDGRLALTQTTSGQNAFVPLFVDLEPRRLKKEITWRQLTVGKERQPVSHEEAVGYRVQVGRLQWLLYRAMGGPATRTVLGKNLFNELLIGRFHAGGGKVTTLVEIEA